MDKGNRPDLLVVDPESHTPVSFGSPWSSQDRTARF